MQVTGKHNNTVFCQETTVNNYNLNSSYKKVEHFFLETAKQFLANSNVFIINWSEHKNIQCGVHLGLRNKIQHVNRLLKDSINQQEKDLVRAKLENLHDLIETSYSYTLEDFNSRRQSMESIWTEIGTWFVHFSPLFSKQYLSEMKIDDKFFLLCLLIQCPFTDEPYYNVYENLSAEEKFFCEFATKSSFPQVLASSAIPYFATSPTNYKLYAELISAKKIPLQDVVDKMGSDEALKIAPYLRYGDFANIADSNWIRAFLQQAFNLTFCQLINSSITQIPSLPCKYLHIENCSTLKQIGELPNCEIFQASNCQLLKTLSSLPSCLFLHIEGCMGIQQLPELFACIYFKCSGSYRINQLPKLPNCQFFAVMDLSIQVIQDIPQCQFFYCYNCPELVEIQRSADYQEFECNECEKLMAPQINSSMHSTALDDLCDLLQKKDLYSMDSCYPGEGFNYQQIVEKIKTWFKDFSSDCAENIEKMSADEKFLFLSLFSRFKFSKAPYSKIYKQLSEPEKQHCKFLKDYKPNVNFDQLFNLSWMNSCNKYRCCAEIISINRIPLVDVIESLGEERTLLLAPYLRHGNFVDIKEAKWIEKFLENSSVLLYVNLEGTKIKSVPMLLACKYLSCEGCKDLERILYAPRCIYLAANECKKLAFIPKKLDKCEQLTIQNSDTILQLPPLPHVNEIDICDCSKIKCLPAAPNLQSLTCIGTAIEKIENLLNCEKIIANGCAHLTHVNNLPKAQELDFSRCPTLIEVINIPLCQTFNVENTPSLIRLPPEMPHCVCFIIENTQRQNFVLPILPTNSMVVDSITLIGSLKINIEDLKDTPLSVLKTVGNFLQEGDFPTIEYMENDLPLLGIDIGGLGRDLVTSLMKGIFIEISEIDVVSPLLLGTRLVLKKGWPSVHPEQNKEKILDHYLSVGMFLALCYSAELDYKTGPVLPFPFYEALADAPWNKDELSISLFLLLIIRGASAQKIVLLLDGGDLSYIEDSTLEEAYYLLGNYVDLDETVDYRTLFADRCNIQNLKQYLIEESKGKPEVQALYKIIEGMKFRLTTNDILELQVRGGKYLQDRLQGVLSKELLLENLHWVNPGNVEQEKVDTTKQYVINWINNPKTTQEDLEYFVRAISGMPTLGGTLLKIVMLADRKGYIPTAETCTFTLDVSVDYQTQQEFDNKLSFLLEPLKLKKGSGFQKR